MELDAIQEIRASRRLRGTCLRTLDQTSVQPGRLVRSVFEHRADCSIFFPACEDSLVLVRQPRTRSPGATTTLRIPLTFGPGRSAASRTPSTPPRTRATAPAERRTVVGGSEPASSALTSQRGMRAALPQRAMNTQPKADMIWHPHLFEPQPACKQNPGDPERSRCRCSTERQRAASHPRRCPRRRNRPRRPTDRLRETRFPTKPATGTHEAANPIKQV
jgi:hypothetical protein